MVPSVSTRLRNGEQSKWRGHLGQVSGTVTGCMVMKMIVVVIPSRMELISLGYQRLGGMVLAAAVAVDAAADFFIIATDRTCVGVAYRVQCLCWSLPLAGSAIGSRIN